MEICTFGIFLVRKNGGRKNGFGKRAVGNLVVGNLSFRHFSYSEKRRSEKWIRKNVRESFVCSNTVSALAYNFYELFDGIILREIILVLSDVIFSSIAYLAKYLQKY